MRTTPRSNAFNWILVSLAAETKALLTGGANKRRRSLNTRRPPNNGPNRPDNPRHRTSPGRTPFCPRLGQRLRIQTEPEPDKSALHHLNLPRSFTHVPADQRSAQLKEKPSKSSPQLQSRQNSYLRAGKTR